MEDSDLTLIPQKTIRRKVQVVGGNTITVSLPRSWADRNRLGRSAGQEQEVAMRYMADGSLLLSPAHNTGKTLERRRVHEISLGTSLSSIKRMIIADFMGGIDIIQMKTRNPLETSVVHTIRDFVDKRLIGFDLIETSYGFDIINMTQSPKFAVDRMMEIIRVQSTQMMEKCYTWLKDSSVDRKALADELHLLEASLDKRSNQMIRTLQLSILDYWMAENVNLPMAEILYWSTTTKAAENGADLAVAIAKASSTIDLSGIDKELLNQIYELGEMTTGLFSKALAAFINHEYEVAHEVLETISKHSATAQRKWPVSKITDLDGPMILIIRHLEKIGVYARKIAEAVIDCESARVAYAASLNEF